MSQSKVEKTRARLAKRYCHPHPTRIPPHPPTPHAPRLSWMELFICSRLTLPAPSIQEGAYYEAHQQLRVLAQRYLKAENYEAAIDILFSGAKALLQAGQGGSGGDLCALMVEVYVHGEVACDAESKGGFFSAPHGEGNGGYGQGMRVVTQLGKKRKKESDKRLVGGDRGVFFWIIYGIHAN